MLYGIFRRTFSKDYDLVDYYSADWDYFDNRREAEQIASELTEIYKEDDGHPWSGCEFIVKEVNDKYLADKKDTWVNQQVASMLL